MMFPSFSIRLAGAFGFLLLSWPVWAQLHLTGDFDHGSLRAWSGDLQQITLTGRDNYYGGGQWRWLYFRATGLAGSRPEFQISSNFAGGASRLADHAMVYSYDNQRWFPFDHHRLARGKYLFSNDQPFRKDEIFVAYAPPYAYGRVVDHTRRVLESPWAQPTASADARGVIGQSPGGIDDLGRRIEPRELFGYRITNPLTDRADRPKRKVVVTSGLHAGETLGSYTFEGLIDWWISDDPRAAALRDVAEVFAYPILNPDGRFAGMNRTTVQNPGQDPNGLWHPNRWQRHREIEVSGRAMLADVRATPGTRVDAFLDFHSTIPAWPGDDFGYLEFEQGDHRAEFWRQLRRLQPNVQEIDSTSSGWTTANFAETFLRAEVDVTFETQFGKNRPIAYYHQLGQHFGVAFYQAWVPEPSSTHMLLSGIGLWATAFRRRRGQARQDSTPEGGPSRV